MVRLFGNVWHSYQLGSSKSPNFPIGNNTPETVDEPWTHRSARIQELGKSLCLESGDTSDTYLLDVRLDFPSKEIRKGRIGHKPGID
jgi:hypothetical protein